MINLIKLHFNYLFSWKIIYISLIILVINLVSFTILSKFYIEDNLLMFYQDFYFEEYLFSSISLMKITILIQSMFIVINSFIINKYDVYLVLRKSKTLVIISKVIVLVSGTIIFSLLLYLIMNIIGMFLTSYYSFSYEIFDLLVDLIIFSSIYTFLFIIMIIIFKNMYSLLLIFIIYFVNNISLEYLIFKSDLNGFSKLLNLVFVDIGYFKDVGFDLYYSKIYLLSICLALFEIICVIYNKSDIIN